MVDFYFAFSFEFPENPLATADDANYYYEIWQNTVARALNAYTGLSASSSPLTPTEIILYEGLDSGGSDAPPFTAHPSYTSPTEPPSPPSTLSLVAKTSITFPTPAISTLAQLVQDWQSPDSAGNGIDAETPNQRLSNSYAYSVSVLALQGTSWWVDRAQVSGSTGIKANSANCFIYGTIFHTLKDNTEVPIEIQNLKVGDLVKTEVYVNQKECQFSLDAWQRIKRMIRRPMTADEYANKTRILPKDALGPGKPDKDLHVTWGHGLLLKEMKEEWKNDEYDGKHVTYSKEHALVKGDFIKLLAGHCALCRKPNEEENKKAADEREKRAYYHLMLEDKEEKSQHALVTHGVTSESLV